jgi:hypothetical protein
MQWQDLGRHLYGSSQGYRQDPETDRLGTMRIFPAAAAPVHAWPEISCHDCPLCQHDPPSSVQSVLSVFTQRDALGERL